MSMKIRRIRSRESPITTCQHGKSQYSKVPICPTTGTQSWKLLKEGITRQHRDSTKLRTYTRRQRGALLASRDVFTAAQKAHTSDACTRTSHGEKSASGRRHLLPLA